VLTLATPRSALAYNVTYKTDQHTINYLYSIDEKLKQSKYRKQALQTQRFNDIR